MMGFFSFNSRREQRLVLSDEELLQSSNSDSCNYKSLAHILPSLENYVLLLYSSTDRLQNIAQ